jgi:hypothetical protein
MFGKSWDKGAVRQREMEIAEWVVGEKENGGEEKDEYVIFDDQ